MSTPEPTTAAAGSSQSQPAAIAGSDPRSQFEKYYKQLAGGIADTTTLGNTLHNLYQTWQTIISDTSSNVAQQSTDRQYVVQLMLNGVDGNVNTNIIELYKRQYLQPNILDKQRHTVIELLTSVITVMQQYVRQYTGMFVVFALYLIRAERVNKCKEKAFELLLTVLSQKWIAAGDDDMQQIVAMPAPADIITQLMSLTTATVSSQTQSFRGFMLSTLGVVSQIFDTTMHQLNADRKLAELYGQVLYTEFSNAGREPHKQLIIGCFIGLKSFLNDHSEQYSDTAKQKHMRLSHIWHCLLAGLNMATADTMARYDLLTVSLQLFAAHAGLFLPYISRATQTESETVVSSLLAGSRHHNTSVSHKASEALDAYLQHLSEILVDDTNQMISTADKKLTAQWLLRVFVSKLESKSVGEISIATRAFGFLAKVIAHHFGQRDLQQFVRAFTQSQSRIQGGLAADQTSTDIELTADEVQLASSQFPTFVSALAFVLKAVDTIDRQMMTTLQQIVLRFMLTYPSLTTYQRSKQQMAIMRILVVLGNKGNLLQQLLDSTVYTGMVLTITPLPTPEVRNGFTPPPRDSYVEYCYMWHALLGVAVRSDDSNDADRTLSAFNKGLNIAAPIVEATRKQLYDAIISNMLKILHTLDLQVINVTALSGSSINPSVTMLSSLSDSTQSLSMALDESSPAVSQQQSAAALADTTQLQPRTPKDFTLFINLVEFAQRFLFPPNLPSTDPLALTGGNTAPSYRARGLQGKIMQATTAGLSTRSGYYVHQAAQNLTLWLVPWLSTLTSDFVQLSHQHTLVSGFYKLMQVVMKVLEQHSALVGEHADAAQKRDDEIAEADTPVNGIATNGAASQSADQQHIRTLISEYLHDTITRLQQYTDELLLSAIRFVLHAPSSFVEVQRFIPALQYALRIGVTHTPTAELAITVIEKWLTKYKQSFQQHLPAIIPHLRPYLSLNPDNDQQLDTAIKVLQLLGRVGAYNEHIVSDNTNTAGSAHSPQVAQPSEQLIAWDTTQHVRYALPFTTLKLDIYLDPLLPLIVNLAENSADRHTRVTACESLHSMLIYMISVKATDPSLQADGDKSGAADKDTSAVLWKHLYPTMLRLAVDVEQVAKQLFSSLTMQLIHWYTQKPAYYVKETSYLLDAITDAVGNATNAGLRDFAASCMAELVRWSGKQLNVRVAADQSQQSPTHIRSLLRRLYSLAAHSSVHKRLGAAITFNAIYRDLREIDILVSIFLLQILYNMLYSLQLTASDEAEQGTRIEVQNVLDNYTRIVVDSKAGKHKLLLSAYRDNQNATVVRAGGSHCKDLDTFTAWLFTRLAWSDDHCRRQAFAMWLAFSPLTKVASTPQAWVQQWQSKNNGLHGLISLIEAPSDENISLSLTTPTALQRSRTAHIAYSALHQWLQSVSTSVDSHYMLLDSGAVDASQTLASTSSSKLLSSVHSVIQYVASNPTYSPTQQYTFKQQATLQDLQCTLLIRIFRLIHQLLKRHITSASIVIDQQFVDLALACALYPEKHGYTLTNSRRVRLVQDTVTALLTALTADHAHTPLVQRSVKEQVDAISHNKSLDLKVMAANATQSEALLDCLRQLQSAGILASAVGESELNHLAQHVATEVYSAIVSTNHQTVEQSPTTKQLCSRLLDLALRVGVDNKVLLDMLTDSYTADESATNGSSHLSTGGLSFFTTYATLLQSYVCTHFATYSKHLLDLAFQQPDVGFCILNSIADYVVKRRNRKLRGTKLALAAADQSTKVAEVEATKVVESALKHLQQSAKHRWKLNSSISVTDDADCLLPLLQFIAKLLAIDSALVLDATTIHTHSLVLDVFSTCLQPKATLQLKRQALSLLHHFLPASHGTGDAATATDAQQKQVLQHIKQLIFAPPFPALSTDLQVGSTEWKEYTEMMDLLLNTVVTTHSLDLLMAILPIIREEKHQYGQRIQLALQRYISAVNQPGKQQQVTAIVDQVYSKYKDDDTDVSPTNNARQWLCTQLLIPLLMVVAKSVVKQFYMQHASDIWAVIEQHKTGPDCNVKSVDDLQLQLIDLQCSFDLLSVMYRRLSVDEIGEVSKTQSKDIMRVTHIHLKQFAPPKGDLIANDATINWPRYYSHAYHLLVSALIKTQNSERFFHVICLSDNPQKNEMLWEHLVNTSTKLEFYIETDFAAISSKMLDFNVAAQVQGRGGRRASAGGATNLRYLSTQYLADSSLSQDVADAAGVSGLDAQQPDAESSELQTNGSEASSVASDSSAMDVDSIATEGSAINSSDDDIIDVDQVVINCPAFQHVLQIIDHVYSRFNSTKSADTQPEWMEKLCTKLASTSTHINIRYTIAKLVILRPHIYERWAHQWFVPLTELAVLSSDRGRGYGFHYFLRDICTTFLRWSTFTPSTTDRIQSDLASVVINHLMKVCTDHGPSGQGKRYRLRSNLLIVKLLVERWKLSSLKLDRSIIYEHLQASLQQGSGRSNANSPGATARTVGFQLLNILLLNGYPAYEPTVDDDKVPNGEASFVELLLDNIRSTYKTLSEPAAEVYGMIVANLYSLQSDKHQHTPHIKQRIALYLDGLRQTLHSMLLSQKFPELMETILLVGRSIHQFQWVGREIVTWLLEIPSLHGEQLHQQLRGLLLASATEVEHFAAIICPTLDRVVRSNDAEALKLGLMLTIKILPQIDTAKLRPLVTTLQAQFSKHSNSECRQLYFRVLTTIYERLAKQQKESPTADVDALLSLVTKALLRGLADADEAIQESIVQFWSTNARLSSQPAERALECLKLYDPTSSDTWLSSMTSLLLQPVQLSTDYNRQLSDKPLQATRFRALTIDPNQTITTSQAFTPLFTTATQQQDDDNAPEMFEEEGDVFDNASDHAAAVAASDQILATQGAAFSQTQQPSLLTMDMEQMVNFNLSQSTQSDAIFFRPVAAGSGTLAAGSYAEYRLTPQQRVQRRQMQGKRQQVAARNGTIASTAVRVKASNGQDVYIARRFASSQADSSSSQSANGSSTFSRSGKQAFFAQQQDYKKRFEQVLKAQARERAQHVTMYRSYRVGELPDIQILHRDLLAPLLALHTDTSIAQQLMASIVTALFTYQTTTDDDTARFKVFRQSLAASFTTVLAQAADQFTTPNASFTSSLFNTMIHCVQSDSESFCNAFDADSIRQIGSIALSSRTYHSGIRLIELLLAHTEKQREAEAEQASSQRATKRSKHSAGSTEQASEAKQRVEQCYYHLARLYRELGETELSFELFSKFARCQSTRDGLAATMSGEYQRAADIYFTAAEQWDQNQLNDALAPTADEIQLWDDERLKCVQQLADWSTLRANVMTDVDQQPMKLYSDDYKHTNYLLYYLQSSLKLSLDFNVDALHAKSEAMSDDESDVKTETPQALFEELISFIQQSLTSESSRALLEGDFTNELLVAYAARADIPRAQTYLRAAYKRFMRRWASLPKLDRRLHRSTLTSLQSLSEVAEYISITPSLLYTHIRSGGDRDKLVLLVRRLQRQVETWSERPVSSIAAATGGTDTVSVWDDQLINRTTFELQMNGEVNEMSNSQSSAKLTPATLDARNAALTSLKATISSTLLDLHHSAALTVSDARNHQLAQRYRQRGKGVSDLLDIALTPVEQLSHQLVGAQLQLNAALQQIESTSLSTSQRSQHLQRVHKVQQYVRQLRSSNGDASTQQHVLQVSVDISNRLSATSSTQSSTDQVMAQINQSTSDDVEQLSDLVSAYTDHDAGTVTAINSICQFTDSELHRYEDHAADCQYCKAGQKCQNSYSINETSNKQAVELLFVTNVLRGMQHRSMTARSLFPRALTITAESPVDSETRYTFMVATTNGMCDEHGQSKAKQHGQLTVCRCASTTTIRIPLWLVLPWISQLFAYSSEPAYIQLTAPILVQLARLYPQAMFFPYQMSLPTLSPVQHADVQYLLQQLQPLLQHRLLHGLTEAADSLTFPHMKYKDMINNATALHKSGQGMQGVMQAYQQFAESVGLVNGRREYVGDQLGEFTREWLKTHRGMLVNAFGAHGERIAHMSIQQWTELSRKLQPDLEKKPDVSKEKGVRPLKRYSEWLARYDRIQATTSEYIEIPGQYQGVTEPLPDTHTRLQSVDSNVLIMSSLRKPKRVKFYGSDEKTYMYLVKGGEDLRLDQRIEQLFATMSTSLTADSNCRRRELSIRTYNVVPMTQQVGMLEWVDHTTPIKELITRQAPASQHIVDKHGHAGNVLDEAAGAYSEYVFDADRKQTTPQAARYQVILEQYSAKQVEAAYTKITRIVPPNLLQRAIESYASSGEAALILRSKFLKSYSTFSIAAYILGIGDRHLDNYLFDASTGEVVGIDFGYSFGMGAMLPVPELVPARLTRQWQHVAFPLDTTQIIRTDMIYSMTSLQQSRHQLLTVLDVFIKEPHLDWVNQAHKHQQKPTATTGTPSSSRSHSRVTAASTSASSNLRGQNEEQPVGTSDLEAVRWIPRNKIAVVNRKLTRYSPTDISIEELKDNQTFHNKPKLLQAVQNHVRGKSSSSYAERASGRCATVADQVDTLISQCTDVNLLGRMWQGWMPFV